MKFTFLFLLVLSTFSYTYETAHARLTIDTHVLIGKWKIDLSPENKSDDKFAMMEISEVNGKTITGTFYREGVKMKDGQLNTQTGIIYGALTSSDRSGKYNTSFYLKDGMLYGTTHSLGRNFLSVWTAIKLK